MVGWAVALAALLLTAAPVSADEGSLLDTVRRFGVLGTWAVECAHAASADDEYSIYMVSTSGEATLTLRAIRLIPMGGCW